MLTVGQLFNLSGHDMRDELDSPDTANYGIGFKAENKYPHFWSVGHRRDDGQIDPGGSCGISFEDNGWNYSDSFDYCGGPIEEVTDRPAIDYWPYFPKAVQYNAKALARMKADHGVGVPSLIMVRFIVNRCSELRVHIGVYLDSAEYGAHLVDDWETYRENADIQILNVYNDLRAPFHAMGINVIKA
jgi:hypothetical protein